MPNLTELAARCEAADASEQRELLEAAEVLRKEAFLLLQQSEGCAANHYGGDIHLFGMPQWLIDSRARIEAAAALLASKENGNAE